MTTLHDRLADLASDAPPGGPVPDLWERGRRIHRQRRVGAAVIAAVAVLALVALGATTWSRSQVEPVPAGPHDGMRLPDRFYEPSRWLPGTDDDGPLGRLVAVLGSERGPVGVAASTGEYRRLDLPDWSGADDVGDGGALALSPDGRRIGYWLTVDRTVVGAAVFDSVTGETTRTMIPSEFGLSAMGMAWVGDRLWISAYAYLDSDRHSARGRATYVWDPSTGVRMEVPLGRSPSFGNETTWADEIVEPTGRGVAFYSPGAPVRRLRVEQPFNGRVVASPGEGRLAVVVDPTPSSYDDRRHPIAVLTPDGTGGTTARRVPGLRANEVVAWRDDERLVVRTYGHPGYDAVDVRTGATEPLVTLPPTPWSPGLQVARDAWGAPTYAAPAPPSPMDPRLVWGGAAAIVLLGAGALVLGRRRVRA